MIEIRMLSFAWVRPQLSFGSCAEAACPSLQVLWVLCSLECAESFGYTHTVRVLLGLGWLVRLVAFSSLGDSAHQSDRLASCFRPRRTPAPSATSSFLKRSRFLLATR